MHSLNDRALKERIIGAVVLVVFAVLVVPVILDGESGPPTMVSERVTLPGQENEDRQQQTIVLERDRSQPVPASRQPTAVAEPQAERQVQTVAERSAPAAPAAAPNPAPEANESVTGMWAVQLGSFSSKENAERLAADLRDQGFAAFLSQLETNSGALQRVRIGPQKDRAAAESIAAQLAQAGHSGRVVPHP